MSEHTGVKLPPPSSPESSYILDAHSSRIYYISMGENNEMIPKAFVAFLSKKKVINLCFGHLSNG